jgi:hypothetical protein
MVKDFMASAANLDPHSICFLDPGAHSKLGFGSKGFIFTLIYKFFQIFFSHKGLYFPLFYKQLKNGNIFIIIFSRNLNYMNERGSETLYMTMINCRTRYLKGIVVQDNI